MRYFNQCRAISMSLGAMLLWAANGVAGNDFPEQEDSEPSVTVNALRLESGVKPKRLDEHVVTYLFWVQSQASLLNLSCVISDLQISEKRKNAGVHVQPMDADLSQGCRIEVPGALATIGGGQFKLAQFGSGKRSAHGGQETDYVTFQTQDNGAFEQDVYVTVFWKQKSPMQLSGIYEGGVSLVAKIPNEIEKPK